MDCAVKKSADITPIVIAVQIVPLMTAQDEWVQVQIETNWQIMVTFNYHRILTPCPVHWPN